jgi:hypothetical protein
LSVYCSFSVFAADDKAGDYPPPLVYRQSHVIPSPDDPRGGSFSLGSIPAFLTHDGYDDRDEKEDLVWPYLRVSLVAPGDGEDTVVLDKAQVRTLRDKLDGWLERVDPELV